MKHLPLLLLLAITTLQLPAQSRWKVVPASSSVTFVIKNAGFKVNGTLGNLKADIDFNKADPTSANIQASVATATIDTDNGSRDSHLKKAEYFNVEKYPTITMQSTSISKAGGANNYNGTFKVTIKGITKNVTFPFTLTEGDNTATFNGSFTINRRDFTVGGSSWILSDNLTVTLKVTATH